MNTKKRSSMRNVCMSLELAYARYFSLRRESEKDLCILFRLLKRSSASFRYCRVDGQRAHWEHSNVTFAKTRNGGAEHLMLWTHALNLQTWYFVAPGISYRSFLILHLASFLMCRVSRFLWSHFWHSSLARSKRCQLGACAPSKVSRLKLNACLSS